MEVEKKLYTVKEVSEMLSIAVSTVYKLIESKGIKAVKIGGSVRIPKYEVERLTK